MRVLPNGFVKAVSVRLIPSPDAHPPREAQVVPLQEILMNRSFSPSPLASLMSMALAAGIAGCASSGGSPSAAAPAPAPRRHESAGPGAPPLPPRLPPPASCRC